MPNTFAHSRRLMIMLMISGGLNIALLSFFFYWMVRERPPTPYYELKPATPREQHPPLALDHGNSQVIRYFRKMPLEWLIARLNNTKLVENGYTQRDLALACLVAFHSFDLQRALIRMPPPEETRTIAYGKYRDGKPAKIVVYPGLTDQHFEAIMNFAWTERWPLTTKGLFYELKKQPPDVREQSLSDAFFMSPEFLTVEMLFSRGDIVPEKNEILNLLIQGNWKTLSAFVEQQKILLDLSAARRQRFLLDYIKQKSKAAAYLILKTDKQFAAQKLDDHHVLMILQLITEPSSEAKNYALIQLDSPRSAAVLKAAAARLFDYAGDPIPEQDLIAQAQKRFLRNKRSNGSIDESGKPVDINENSEMAKKEISKKRIDPSDQTTKNVMPKNETPVSKKETPTVRKELPVVRKEIPTVRKEIPVVRKDTPVIRNEMQTGRPSPAPTVPTKPIGMIPKPPGAMPVQPGMIVKPPPVSRRERIHIVQNGETLWKIASQYQIDIAVLRAYNGLENDALRPGRPLRIP